jgi:hypothetical protein
MIIKDEKLLASFRRKKNCEWCGRSCPDGCDPHHAIVKRGLGGGSRLDHKLNLVALDRSCHNDVHAGVLTKYDMAAIIAQREGVTQDFVFSECERLRRLDKFGK